MFGSERFIAVQKGRGKGVEFKDLFQILKKNLADGDDVPYFFRDLMAMLTTVDENEWGTSKDPSAKTSDETLRTYAKRGISKKLAQAIVYRLTPENLVSRIDERPDTARQLLADDCRGYDASLNADNIADAMGGWIVESIQKKAGLVQQDKLAKQKQVKIAAELKNKFGYYLLNEENHFCPFPGCGRSLTVTSNGKASDVFEVSLIDKDTAPEIHNLLALCPRCHATYLIDNNKKVCKELRAVKTVLEAHRNSVSALDDLPLQKGIVDVIRRIKKFKEKDLADASLNPKEIKKKLNPADNMALYSQVNYWVITYFVKIRDIMIYLDKSGEIDYEEVQDQMKAIYKRLKKAKKSNMEIFSEIVGKIHRVSMQEDTYCQIVVSYFVQSCEVFDAIT